MFESKTTSSHTKIAIFFFPLLKILKIMANAILLWLENMLGQFFETHIELSECVPIIVKFNKIIFINTQSGMDLKVTCSILLLNRW